LYVVEQAAGECRRMPANAEKIWWRRLDSNCLGMLTTNNLLILQHARNV